jgi:hypothetical protein
MESRVAPTLLLRGPPWEKGCPSHLAAGYNNIVTRYLAVPVLAAAICLSATAQAPLTKQQKIERILDATKAGVGIDEIVVTQVRDMLKQIQPNPNATQQLKRQAALDKIAKLARDHIQKIRPQLIKAYEDTFNDDEIDAMFAFYTSPAGKAATDKMGAANDRISILVQNELNTAGSEINKIAEETLR